MNNKSFFVTTFIALFGFMSLFAGTTITHHYVHTATTANSSGHITKLNRTIPSRAIVTVTQAHGSIYNNNEIGVWHNGTEWTIFNQNFAAITGAMFNVVVTQESPNYATVTGMTAFTFTASSATIRAHIATIDHPATNGKPNAVIILTANYGASGPYNVNPVGLWYDGGKWKIFNQNRVAMPVNAKYNVLVLDMPTNTPTDVRTYAHEPARYTIETKVHTTNASNIRGHLTYLEPFTYGGSIFATPVYIDTYEPNTFGIMYSSGMRKYTIFHQNIAAIMRTNVRFNLLNVSDVPW